MGQLAKCQSSYKSWAAQIAQSTLVSQTSLNGWTEIKWITSLISSTAQSGQSIWNGSSGFTVKVELRKIAQSIWACWSTLNGQINYNDKRQSS